jgi:hypothetical protein
LTGFLSQLKNNPSFILLLNLRWFFTGWNRKELDD